MGAAAQLDRIGTFAGQGLAQGQDPHAVAVFFAEQGHGAGGDGLIGGHDLSARGQVLADHRIDLGLDAIELLPRQGAAVREVETHPLAIDHLALLGHVRTQDMM